MYGAEYKWIRKRDLSTMARVFSAESANDRSMQIQNRPKSQEHIGQKRKRKTRSRSSSNTKKFDNKLKTDQFQNPASFDANTDGISLNDSSVKAQNQRAQTAYTS